MPTRPRPAAPRVRSRGGRPAFTLIELLSAVLIVGLLAAIALPSLNGSITKAKTTRAIGDIRTLAQDLTGQDSLPPSLAAIGRGDLRDPWGRPYVYVQPGAHGQFDLYSLGRDGAPGGEGVDADIGNWDDRK